MLCKMATFLLGTKLDNVLVSKYLFSRSILILERIFNIQLEALLRKASFHGTHTHY